MYAPVQRIVSGIPKTAAATSQAVRANPILGLGLILFVIATPPVAVLTFLVGAYLVGSKDPS